ncbi:hypothetical protein DSOL_3290 [Desulfosporosinus metallidurans]|uniref:Uncharacterized protein n=1 Tax=Desulfosporosinus metallidurans TaxID=1888891 RepID=A0A1Q8QRL7_9FIRM|nr:hypothetical protein DSOL_3290 [Desulfosporosinus metallidurans]
MIILRCKCKNQYTNICKTHFKIFNFKMSYSKEKRFNTEEDE